MRSAMLFAALMGAAAFLSVAPATVMAAPEVRMTPFGPVGEPPLHENLPIRKKAHPWPVGKRFDSFARGRVRSGEIPSGAPPGTGGDGKAKRGGVSGNGTTCENATRYTNPWPPNYTVRFKFRQAGETKPAWTGPYQAGLLPLNAGIKEDTRNWFTKADDRSGFDSIQTSSVNAAVYDVYVAGHEGIPGDARVDVFNDAVLLLFKPSTMGDPAPGSVYFVGVGHEIISHILGRADIEALVAGCEAELRGRTIGFSFWVNDVNPNGSFPTVPLSLDNAAAVAAYGPN